MLDFGSSGTHLGAFPAFQSLYTAANAVKPDEVELAKIETVTSTDADVPVEVDVSVEEAAGPCVSIDEVGEKGKVETFETEESKLPEPEATPEPVPEPAKPSIVVASTPEGRAEQARQLIAKRAAERAAWKPQFDKNEAQINKKIPSEEYTLDYLCEYTYKRKEIDE